MFKKCIMLVATLLFFGNAVASDYPTRPITLVVPFPPGANSDVTARAVGEQMSKTLGQPVIVENKSGANGGIAMQYVARSKPDGYTLVVSTVSTTIIPPIISKNLLVDLFEDFIPVATISNTPLLLTVAQESELHSVADIVTKAKANPGTLTYGDSAGLYRIAMEAFNHYAGIDILGIPYRGSPAATIDLLGGRLSINPNALGSVMPMLKDQRIRALAVLGSSRVPELPDVPTMIELGYDGYEFNGWSGILAPAGTPQSVVDRLYNAIEQAVQSPPLQKLYTGLGLEPTVLSSEQYEKTLRNDSKNYQMIADSANIEKQ